MTIGNFSPVLGSTSSDSLQANNLDLIYGLSGNDNLSTNGNFALEDFAILVGGSGDDQYSIAAGTSAAVFDNGLSDDSDTIIFNGSSANTEFVTVDNNAHLYMLDTTTDTYLLLLNYQDTENQIESFEFADGSLLPADLTAVGDAGNDITLEQLQSESASPGNSSIDFDSLGLPVDTLSEDIEEVRVTDINFENTVLPSGSILENPLTTSESLESTDNSYTFNGEEYFYDFYSLDSGTFSEGDTVEFTLNSSTFSTALFLLDSRGNVLEFENDADGVNDVSGGSFTNLSVTIPSNEPLFLSVESSDAGAVGDYFLSFTTTGSGETDESDGTDETIPENGLPIIQTTDSVTGEITVDDGQNPDDAGNIFFTDGFTFEDDASGEVLVTLNSDFDGVIFVDETTPDGTTSTLLRVDDLIAGATEEGSFFLTPGNSYRLFVDTFEPEETGSYTLTTEFVGEAEPPEEIVPEEVVPEETISDTDNISDGLTTIQTTDSITGDLATNDDPIDTGDGLFYSDILLFEGDMAGEVEVTLESDFDGLLFLSPGLDENGELLDLITINDRFAGGIEEGTFTFEPQQGAAIIVTSFDPEDTGSYIISTEFVG